jgi:thioesterase domain-containing protein
MNKRPEQLQLVSHFDPVMEIQPFGDLPPFFCVPGIGGHVEQFYRLAAHMGKKRPFLAFRRPAEMRALDTINQMAAVYVAAMLRRQCAGPFYLGGHSLGAVLAYEMAVQLLARGHEIGRLIIIDQEKPGWRLTVRDAIPILHLILAHLRSELSSLPAAQRFRYVQRTLLGWLKAAAGQRPTASSYFDLKDREQIAFYDAFLVAVQKYQPKPVLMPITLFRANVQRLSSLALDYTLGWQEFAKGKVRVHVVPGDHNSILAEPLVRRWAKVLSDELDASVDAKLARVGSG